MKSNQQIIQETYDTKPSLKEQLDYYGLTLDDVGIRHYMHSGLLGKNGESNMLLGDFSNGLPIVLFYSLKDDEAFSYSVDFTHPDTEESMREKRLKRIAQS